MMVLTQALAITDIGGLPTHSMTTMYTTEV